MTTESIFLKCVCVSCAELLAYYEVHEDDDVYDMPRGLYCKSRTERKRKEKEGMR